MSFFWMRQVVAYLAIIHYSSFNLICQPTITINMSDLYTERKKLAEQRLSSATTHDVPFLHHPMKVTIYWCRTL